MPGVLLYGVSMQFAVNSIDSWFDVRVDTALEGGLNLGRSVLDNLQTDLLEKGRTAAFDLGEDGFVSSARLNRVREQAGAQTAILLSTSGQVLASSSGELDSLLPSLPSPTQLRSARSGRGQVSMGETAEENTGGGTNRWLMRALFPVRGGMETGLHAEPRILQLTLAVPSAIARSAESVEAAHHEYQQLQLGRSGLKRIYTLTLTLALLLALLAAIGLAYFLAERLAKPLLILAEGTRAVAAGDFTPRATVNASDELSILTHSFNSMTQQLREARSETEVAQAYLSSVLANLSAGVLAFDLDFRLRAANRGACAILGDDLEGFAQLALSAWPRHDALAESIQQGFSRSRQEWQEQIEIVRADAVPQTLLLRGTCLPAAGGGGYVVVFDDITDLIAGQRSAAWGEVARRLAHEIKNPLTPIQLSAERLQIKLANELNGASRELLDRGTQTIVNQVEALKNMVNEFRDYARTPPPQLAAIDLPALIAEVAELHANGRTRIVIAPLSDSAPLPPALADSSQLRQVLHNLLANAQDALEAASDATTGEITLTTARDHDRVRLTISDNGPGFSPQMLSRVFEPYVTTKAKGTGLGLAIVKKIITDHGGEIRVANHSGGSSGSGGEVTLWLPLAARKSLSRNKD
jgi:nitrogen fixation/metabolism regulation signal transduction histidine kinase